MAVVIDEMEVAPAAAEPTRGSDGNAPAGKGEQQEKPPDHEVQRMMRRQMERAERVWARSMSWAR